MIETLPRERVAETPRPINTRFTGKQKVWLTLLGIGAVGITGFLGYPPSATGAPPAPLGLDTLFAKPWLLFAWFLMLIMVLEGAMIWKPTQRQQLRRAQSPSW